MPRRISMGRERNARETSQVQQRTRLAGAFKVNPCRIALKVFVLDIRHENHDSQFLSLSVFA